MRASRMPGATEEPRSLPPRGEWIPWTPGRARDDEALRDAVARFSSLDHPAGLRATSFLHDASLADDPATRTRLLVIDGTVEAFISLASSVVSLLRSDVEHLAVAPGPELPATLLTWIAKRRGSDVPGFHILSTAYGIAREAAETVGSVAFVVDAADEPTHRIWTRPPYNFRPTRRANRLWLPMIVED